MPDCMPLLEMVGRTFELSLLSEEVLFNGSDATAICQFKDEEGHRFLRADRTKLCRWWMTGLNISWDKTFTHYDENEQGVVAFFNDGTSAKGDILVGSDEATVRPRMRYSCGSYLLTGTD